MSLKELDLGNRGGKKKVVRCGVRLRAYRSVCSVVAPSSLHTLQVLEPPNKQPSTQHVECSSPSLLHSGLAGCCPGLRASKQTQATAAPQHAHSRFSLHDARPSQSRAPCSAKAQTRSHILSRAVSLQACWRWQQWADYSQRHSGQCTGLLRAYSRPSARQAVPGASPIAQQRCAQDEQSDNNGTPQNQALLRGYFLCACRQWLRWPTRRSAALRPEHRAIAGLKQAQRAAGHPRREPRGPAAVRPRRAVRQQQHTKKTSALA